MGSFEELRSWMLSCAVRVDTEVAQGDVRTWKVTCSSTDEEADRKLIQNRRDGAKLSACKQCVCFHVFHVSGLGEQDDAGHTSEFKARGV